MYHYGVVSFNGTEGGTAVGRACHKLLHQCELGRAWWRLLVAANQVA